MTGKARVLTAHVELDIGLYNGLEEVKEDEIICRTLQSLSSVPCLAVICIIFSSGRSAGYRGPYTFGSFCRHLSRAPGEAADENLQSCSAGLQDWRWRRLWV